MSPTLLLAHASRQYLSAHALQRLRFALIPASRRGPRRAGADVLGCRRLEAGSRFFGEIQSITSTQYLIEGGLEGAHNQCGSARPWAVLIAIGES